MSATIDEITCHRAECYECGWKGKVRKSDTRALDDAQDHDEERHNPWRRPANAEIASRGNG